MSKYLEALLSNLASLLGFLGVVLLLISRSRASDRSLHRLYPTQDPIRPTFIKWAAATFVAMLIAWAIFLTLLGHGAFR